MKRKNIILVMLFVFSFGLFTIQSCKKEDPTTFKVEQAFTNPLASTSLPKARKDGTIFVTGTTVDLKWVSANSAGDPVKWFVYYGTDADPALFDSTTKTTLNVPVLDGKTYYWYVKTKDSRGIVTTGPVNSFTAIDGSNPYISIDLTTQTNVKTAVGLDLAPDKVVDLRFLIVNKSGMVVDTIVDYGYAAETFDALDAYPNGEYLLAVDVGATINAGQFSAPITLDLSLKFAQLGMIDTTLDFPGVMTNEKACSYYRTYLATITKAGSAYTIAKDNYDWIDPSAADPSAMVGSWIGKDLKYASEITSTVTGGKLMFDGIGNGWMQNWWGEVIVTHTPVEAVFNPADGTFTIANQPVMTTTYDDGKGGGPQPQPAYFIEGTITANFCGGPDLVISYDFIQPDGAGGIAQYYTPKISKFTATVTLSASGKKEFMETFGSKIKGLK